jgi:hypothetical protein
MKADKIGFYVFLILLKNEPQIGRRPIKEMLCFLFIFVEKCTPNRPKTDKGGYYIFNSILMKNEPQIGRRQIKVILCFLFNFFGK